MIYDWLRPLEGGNGGARADTPFGGKVGGGLVALCKKKLRDLTTKKARYHVRIIIQMSMP